MRVVLAKTTIDHLAQVDAMAAARGAIEALARRLDGLGGIILLDRYGNVGHAYNTPRMAYAYVHEGLENPIVGI